MSQGTNNGSLQISASGASIALDPATGNPSVRQGRLARLLSFDEALLLAFQRLHRPERTALARTLTHAGDAKTWTFVGLALLATRSSFGIHLGLRLAAATLTATLLVQVLKRSLTRPRPDASIVGFEALASNPDRFSFPSGHTAAAFAVAIAWATEPFGLGPAALLLASGIGLSRVYLGAHYPLDVAAGLLLGTLSGLVSRLVVG